MTYRSLNAILLATCCFASTGCWDAHFLEYEPVPFEPNSGWACDIDADPVGSSKNANAFSFRYQAGGDEDPTDDSRTVWIRPDEDGMQLRAPGGDNVSLTEGELYLLEIVEFTDEAPTTTRNATLTHIVPGGGGGSVGSVVPLTLPLETGIDWDLDDFLTAVAPNGDGFVTVYMLDAAVNSSGADIGYCVTIEVGKEDVTGATTALDLQVQLDPLGTAPEVPEATVQMYFDGRRNPSNPNTTQDFHATVRADENLEVGSIALDATDLIRFQVGALMDHTSGTALTLRKSQAGSTYESMPPLPVGSTAYVLDESGGFPGIGAVVVVETDSSTDEQARLVLVEQERSATLELVQD